MQAAWWRFKARRTAAAVAVAFALTSCGAAPGDLRGHQPAAVITTSTGSTTTPSPPATPTTEATPAVTVTSTTTDPGLRTIPLPARVPAEAATVVSVTDGDTLQILVGGRPEPLRLIGVNTPEDGECLAVEAADFLGSLVEGRSLALVGDVSHRDRYDRLLRYAWAGDIFLNEALVRSGLAIAAAYPPDLAYAGLLAAAQAEARQARRGMWAPDACGPSSGAAILISHIEYNPPGDDTLDLNAEFITLTNATWAPVDLTGWILKDESAAHRYRFPAGFVLLGGDTVTVHTGSGADTAEDLYWGHSGSGIWNNDGDTAYLLDPTGNIAASRSYP